MRRGKKKSVILKQDGTSGIRPQCLFSSVVSTYRYNTVSFCKTKKKLSMLTECQSSRLHPSFVYTPATCSPRASTFPNGRHFEGLKHL